MNFGFTGDVIEPSIWEVEVFFWGLLLLTPWIVMPLIRWVGPGPRMIRGFLSGRVTGLQRFVDQLAWSALAMTFVGPCLFAALFICVMEAQPTPGCEVLHIDGQWSNAPPSLLSLEYWLPGFLLTAMLVGAVSLVHAWWLRSASSHRDVLHIA